MSLNSVGASPTAPQEFDHFAWHIFIDPVRKINRQDCSISVLQAATLSRLVLILLAIRVGHFKQVVSLNL